MLIIIVFLWDFNLYVKNQVEKEIHSYMTDIRQQSVLSLNSNMKFLSKRLEEETVIFNMKGEMTEQEILDELIRFSKGDLINRATIIAVDGTVYSSEFGIQKIDINQFPNNLTENEVRINKPRLYKPTGEYFIDIAIPVSINHKKFGTLSISYNRENLQQIFQVAFLEGDCSINLISGDGTLIGRISDNDPPEFLKDNLFEFYRRDDVEFINGSLEEMTSNISKNGTGWLDYIHNEKKYSLTYAPVGINDWYIGIGTSDNQLAHRIEGLQSMAKMLTVKVVTVCVIFAALLFGIGMSERKRLKRLKEAYRLALRKSNDLFIEINVSNDTYVNHAEERNNIIGQFEHKKYSELIDSYSQYCASTYKENFMQIFSHESLVRYLQEGIELVTFEYKMVHPNHSEFWISSSVIPIVYSARDGGKIICIGKDITEQKKKNKMLIDAAMMDRLTGLLNKAATEEVINKFLNSADDKCNHAFLMIDLDHFKAVNDNLGHAKGDEVLALFGNILQSSFRKNDIVGRTGGDEFVVLIKDCTRQEIISKAKEINQTFRPTYYTLEDNPIPIQVTLSIGIAVYKEDGMDFEELYKNADTALYCSKREGKNQVTFFDEI